MILQQYIQEVLFRQRVCIVPQIGTFTIQHFPAQYNAAAQTLTAPRDQVIFSKSWKDDGSCLEWIALKENLVPSVAQRKLEKYLEEFKAALQSGNTLELPGIGKLQGDFTGNIHFYPEELPVDAAALPITPIQRQEPPAAPVFTPPAATTPPPPEPPVNTPNEVVEPVMTEEEEDTLEAVREGGIFKWWQAVAAVVFLAGGFGAWWYVSHQSGSGKPEPATAIVADTTAKAPKDTVAVTPAVPDSISYFVVLDEYKDSLRAAHQLARRKLWEQDVVMYKRGNIYKVATPVTSLPIDTTSKLQEKKSEFKTSTAYLEY